MIAQITIAIDEAIVEEAIKQQVEDKHIDTSLVEEDVS